MKNITYINAGAGSGKTYALTNRLASLIQHHAVEPEQVILTTFTTKAADEFKEKAKSFLFQKGLINEAIRLDQALIGTIHSVAYALINKYWFKLGLPPNMGVMAEEDVEFYISQSLSSLPNEDELSRLHSFVREFDIRHGYKTQNSGPNLDAWKDFIKGIEENQDLKHLHGIANEFVFNIDNKANKSGLDFDIWKDHLKRIIDLATNYEITDFSKSYDESIALLKSFVIPGATISHTTDELKLLLQEHEDTLNLCYKESATNNERKADLQELKSSVRDVTIAWYRKLASLLKKTENKNGPRAKAILQELNILWRTDLVFEKQEVYISILFELALRWQQNYAAFKKENHVLDFNDMEKYLLQLLEDDSVCNEIERSFKFLFVDEFQDCSPIQVKIFDRLSDLMFHSFWVGDYKQSIYGFRGSDIDLVQAVVDNISQKKSCNIETLDTSWRSLPDIVDICNESFKRVFENELPEENIVLKKHRKNDDNTSSLRYVTVNKNKKSTVELAAQIAYLIKKEHVAPKHIAVICRTNDELDMLSIILQSQYYNLPVSRNNLPVTENNAAILVKALLQILEDDNNSLAKSTVAWLTEKDFDTSHLIDTKLDWDANTNNKPWQFLNDTPLIAQLLQNRDALRQQNIASLVETLIIELGIYDVAKQWPKSSWSTSCLDVLITSATAYEQHARQLNMPSSISGFLDYLDLMAPVASGDKNGIQLHTYHSCKGLEWKYVFLASLNRNIRYPMRVVKNNIFGVNFCRTSELDSGNLYPDVFIRVAPFIYGSSNTNVPPDIFDIIINSPAFTLAYIHAISEAKRLLYVGMTRARDVLILTVESTKSGNSKRENPPFQWLMDVGLQPRVYDIGKDEVDLLNVGIDFINATASDAELATIKPFADPEAKYNDQKLSIDKDNINFRPRDISPSSTKATAKVISHEIIGNRLTVNSVKDQDYAEVGNCIHQIFCALDHQNDPLSFAKNLINAYELNNVLTDAQAIIAAWNNLKQKLTSTYGEPINIYHERPFQQSLNGQIITGSIDLVWQTEKGSVIIDFKTNPMATTDLLNPQSDHFVGNYGGQISAYANALSAAEENVLATLIYYPVSALLVSLKPLSISEMGLQKTYLLRWNPTISSFKPEDYNNAVVNNNWQGMNWSINDYENAHYGDEYFMLRTGDDEAGIVWQGTFLSDPYTSDDWAGAQKKRHYVNIDCQNPVLPTNPPHISLSDLQKTLPEIDWQQGHSGQQLTQEQAQKLINLWNKRSNKL